MIQQADKYGYLLRDDEKDLSKRCALIAVEEIIDVLGGAGVFSFADPSVTQYWEQVKQEIERL